MVPEEQDDPTFRVDIPLSYADMERVIAGLSHMTNILKEDADNCRTNFVAIMTRDERDQFAHLRNKLTDILRRWDEFN